jgi:2-polyprenyl-6-methoxyphenol hydroxylase-like FAD-dependent oxidoreductase
MSLNPSNDGVGDGLTPRYGPELRVLIVGAGVTGLTLAALLEQRGFTPTIVERRTSYDDAGCVLGLWPAGSRVLKGLGLFRAFLNTGLECTRYTVANAAGEVLHSYSLEPLAERYGPLVNVFRPDLIALLREAVAPDRLRFGVRVRDIADTPNGVVALFDDGTNETFDLIVACDGLRSGIRRLAFGDDPRPQAGMMGWGISCPVSFVPPREITEYWGAGRFFAIYPARDRLYAFAGVRADVPSSDPIDGRVARLRSEFRQFGGLVPWVLGQLGQLGQPDRIFHQDYLDLRMESWHRGRVVLVGHAAHAVLGTGGLGTSLAMESAAVLADELCRADSSRITLAFEQYTARRRTRVDHVLSWSRRLGRFMFSGNRFVARLRDGAVHLTADEQLLVGVERVLSEPL